MKIDHAIADGVGLLDVLFNIIDNKGGGDSPKKLLDSVQILNFTRCCWERSNTAKQQVPTCSNSIQGDSL